MGGGAVWQLMHQQQAMWQADNICRREKARVPLVALSIAHLLRLSLYRPPLLPDACQHDRLLALHLTSARCPPGNAHLATVLRTPKEEQTHCQPRNAHLATMLRTPNKTANALSAAQPACPAPNSRTVSPRCATRCHVCPPLEKQTQSTTKRTYQPHDLLVLHLWSCNSLLLLLENLKSISAGFSPISRTICLSCTSLES